MTSSGASFRGPLITTRATLIGSSRLFASGERISVYQQVIYMHLIAGEKGMSM